MAVSFLWEKHFVLKHCFSIPTHFILLSKVDLVGFFLLCAFESCREFCSIKLVFETVVRISALP